MSYLQLSLVDEGEQVMRRFSLGIRRRVKRKKLSLMKFQIKWRTGFPFVVLLTTPQSYFILLFENLFAYLCELSIESRKHFYSHQTLASS
jgi:CRISPR/Cas system-associated protein Csx1